MKRSLIVFAIAAIALVFSSCGAAAGKSAPSVSEVIQKMDTADQTKQAGAQEKSAEKGKDQKMNSGQKEIATLAGGCFWCLDAVYVELRGVEKVVSGYSGGKVNNPTYEQVSMGNTGHAEVVQITYDPQVITFKELLEVFFTIHDPTTLNRQGGDVGTQYRSAIFYHNDDQKAVAEKVVAEINAAKIWDDPIVTEVTKLANYYPAEDYHQLYYARNPNAGYCRVVIAPKVNKFRKQFISKLKKQTT